MVPTKVPTAGTSAFGVEADAGRVPRDFCFFLTQLGHQCPCNPDHPPAELRYNFLSGEMHMGRPVLSIGTLLAGWRGQRFCDDARMIDEELYNRAQRPALQCDDRDATVRYMQIDWQRLERPGFGVKS